MIEDVSFYNPWLKPSVNYRACNDTINRAGSLFSKTRGFINSWNHPKTKHKIYKILNFFVCIKI